MANARTAVIRNKSGRFQRVVLPRQQVSQPAQQQTIPYEFRLDFQPKVLRVEPIGDGGAIGTIGVGTTSNVGFGAVGVAPVSFIIAPIFKVSRDR